MAFAECENQGFAGGVHEGEESVEDVISGGVGPVLILGYGCRQLVEVRYERVDEIDHGVPHMVEEANDSMQYVVSDGDGASHDVLVVIKEADHECHDVDDGEKGGEFEKELHGKLRIEGGKKCETR